jgi:hypothetical protein
MGHFFNMHDLKKEIPSAMDGELELFQEITDTVMLSHNLEDVELDAIAILRKSIRQIAEKLVQEGLTTKNFTIEKAIKVTRDVAAPIYVKKLIETATSHILIEMKSVQIKNTSTKFGL